MKDIVFILSSLNDTHFQKRVKSFIEDGYNVTVYGYKRKGQPIPDLPYKYNVLGEISSRAYFSRLQLYYNTIKGIAKECNGKLCFYSSLDIAIFAIRLIHSSYIYEVCDLTELCIKNKLVREFLISQNKKVIKKSLLTIFTSEGFVDFFKDTPDDKYIILPNKVSKDCKPTSINRNFPSGNIKIGFVGVIRFESTYIFIKNCIEESENIQIHLYGIYSDGDIFSHKIRTLQECYPSRIFYHGRFSNPNDLPRIYSEIDLVLSAYPPTPGVIHAEPNKLYEALFFNCPIIVSENTFLAKKVKKLGVGYVINSMEKHGISKFLEDLSYDSYFAAYNACKNIPQGSNFEDYTVFFEKLRKLI